ncbi:hypothetical protein [Halomicrococcus sp. SG-WS-1]|uniref:hypothetical protein n=1 Tax=Halomicrococcus sp. SG-WS-1 TaxID=3439057 RepID=UPI003F7A879E
MDGKEESTDTDNQDVGVLEIGAGQHPHPRSDSTLDIRSDLDHIDYPGVDIGEDVWPIENESVSEILAYHVVEHVPPNRVGHVFQEVDRVLVSGGTIHIELPYSGTYAAATDLTHYGTGGTTAGIDRYFTGDLEEYWPNLDWDVTSYAELEFPLFVRSSLRFNVRMTNSELVHELIKIPFVTGKVIFDATKR